MRVEECRTQRGPPRVELALGGASRLGSWIFIRKEVVGKMQFFESAKHGDPSALFEDLWG